MNVFVLCSSPCQVSGFLAAAANITNYTLGQNSRRGFLGDARFTYPSNHIEFDVSIPWLLGRLQPSYKSALYLNFLNDRKTCKKDVAAALECPESLPYAYWRHILVCTNYSRTAHIDYIEEVQSNIALYLADKSLVVTFSDKTILTSFSRFWEISGAKGDYKKAISAFGRESYRPAVRDCFGRMP